MISNSNVDTKKIPVGQILYSDYLVRCDVSSGTGNVGNIIKKSYKQFASGAIADGIAEVLEGGLETLLGNFNGSTSRRET